jgi:hypothetical protein
MKRTLYVLWLPQLSQYGQIRCNFIIMGSNIAFYTYLLNDNDWHRFHLWCLQYVTSLSAWFALKFKQKTWHAQNFLLLALPLGWFHISSAVYLSVPQHLPHKYSGMLCSIRLQPTFYRNVLTIEKKQEVNTSLFIKTGSTLHYTAVRDRTKYIFLHN